MDKNKVDREPEWTPELRLYSILNTPDVMGTYFVYSGHVRHWTISKIWNTHLYDIFQRLPDFLLPPQSIIICN